MKKYLLIFSCDNCDVILHGSLNIVLFKYLFLLLSVFEGPSSPPGPISWKEFVCMYSLLGLQLAEKMWFF